jgi:mannitol-1-phosphate 5-dehydrogenase
MLKNKFVLFGAGNIGRSFIGQVFARSGYETVFVDVDRKIIDALNARRSYQVVIKSNDAADRVIEVPNVRGVFAGDVQAVINELSDASYAATAVGANVLGKVVPVIAAGVSARMKSGIARPLDIILAENLRDAASFVRGKLAEADTTGQGIADATGLVETSIGKMVPIMKDSDRLRDPLLVYAEAYNSLIVDKYGFKNQIPQVTDLKPVENIAAYVDRKLFIHNLGHAASAYFGNRLDPSLVFIWQSLDNKEILGKVRCCMTQAARALNRQYPKDLEQDALSDHIEDLLTRFSNKALGDTIYRVGRDLCRKLDKNDRLVGAMLLCRKHGLACDEIADAVAAGCAFKAADENGKRPDSDINFTDNIMPQGIGRVMADVCNLSEAVSMEADVMGVIAEAVKRMG